MTLRTETWHSNIKDVNNELEFACKGLYHYENKQDSNKYWNYNGKKRWKTGVCRHRTLSTYKEVSKQNGKNDSKT